MDSGLFFIIIILLVVVFTYVLIQAFKMSMPKKKKKVSNFTFMSL
jgi:hypothetical protein